MTSPNAIWEGDIKNIMWFFSKHLLKNLWFELFHKLAFDQLIGHLTMDQKVSGLNPDRVTDNQALRNFLLGAFLLFARIFLANICIYRLRVCEE